jgi:hypothetical protein
MLVEHSVDLTCHPSAPTGPIRAIEVHASRTPNAELRMSFRLIGNISRICLPSPSPGKWIGSQLWQHTCFEAFIALQQGQAYHEFNFAPSGEWAVYAYCGYRSGRLLTNEEMRPDIVTRSTATQLELDACVRLDRLSDVHVFAPLRVGLSAVIETRDGLSYWALRHPAARPDFHHPAGFALLVAAPQVDA